MGTRNVEIKGFSKSKGFRKFEEMRQNGTDSQNQHILLTNHIAQLWRTIKTTLFYFISQNIFTV